MEGWEIQEKKSSVVMSPAQENGESLPFLI